MLYNTFVKCITARAEVRTFRIRLWEAVSVESESCNEGFARTGYTCPNGMSAKARRNLQPSLIQTICQVGELCDFTQSSHILSCCDGTLPPTMDPSFAPTLNPTLYPSRHPTNPTLSPTFIPSFHPTAEPSLFRTAKCLNLKMRKPEVNVDSVWNKKLTTAHHSFTPNRNWTFEIFS